MRNFLMRVLPFRSQLRSHDVRQGHSPERPDLEVPEAGGLPSFEATHRGTAPPLVWAVVLLLFAVAGLVLLYLALGWPVR